jgi:hypothetical protein
VAVVEFTLMGRLSAFQVSEAGVLVNWLPLAS